MLVLCRLPSGRMNVSHWSPINIRCILRWTQFLICGHRMFGLENSEVGGAGLMDLKLP